jgi:hypothetical protein
LSLLQLGISDSAFDFLFAKTGGHPYCVMAVMANAYLYTQIHHHSLIDTEISLIAYEQSLAQLDAAYKEQWQEIRHHKDADFVL